MYIAKSAATAKNLSFQLKVGGFVAVSESDSLIAVRKPDYEVGSSVKVVDTASNGDSQKKKLWSVEAMDDLEADDLINDEELLDEADRAKPSAEELRVCATTKQRKACANCSCGLAQELEAEEKEKIRENSQNAKSSCGSVSSTAATTKLLTLISKLFLTFYSATWAMRSVVPPAPTEACQHSNRGKRWSLMLATICEEERMMHYYCSILLLIVTQQRFSKLCFTVLFPIFINSVTLTNTQQQG